MTVQEPNEQRPGLIGETQFEQAVEMAIRGETGEEEETPPPNDDDAPSEDDDESEDVEEVDDGDEAESDDGSGTDGEEVDESSPTDEAASSSFTLGDRTLSVEEIQQGDTLRTWWQSLPPEAYTAIDALLSGQYRLVPASQLDQLQQQPPTTPVEDVEDQIDPQAHQRITQIESDLAALREAELRTQQDTQMQIINAAQDSWAANHKNLTEGELLALRNEVARLRILPGLLSSKGGDLTAAMQTALDYAYWSNPEYRENEVNATLARERDEAKTTVQRKRKASSLSGGGSSAPRTPPPANTPESRRAAMIEEIAAAQNGGTLT